MTSWHAVLFVIATLVALLMFAHTEDGRATALSFHARHRAKIEAPPCPTTAPAPTPPAPPR
jgi:hypothetical protein